MVRKILAAVDNSPRAASVVKAALELAAPFGAEVTLLRVVAVPQDFPPAAAHPDDRLQVALEQTARAQLLALAAGQPGLKVADPVVYPGQPWRAIIDAAKTANADLIVIGSHGYRGWDRILGTTASKVADHADRNVLVVHEQR